MLLANAISCFLLLVETERRLSPRTVNLYSKGLAVLESFATAKGRTRLADFTPNLVRAAAAAQMTGEDHAANFRGGEAMAAILIAASRTMVRTLHVEYPELSLPDLSVIRAPKVPERIQPRLQDGEYARLEAALRMRLLRDRVPRFLIARDMAILVMLANTGLRAAECCGLDVEDIDLDEGTVKVRKGKGNKWRILTVRDPDPSERDGGEVVRGLDDYLRYRAQTFGPGRSRALWLTPKGNRLTPNDLRRALSLLCEEAGIDGNRPPHAFRRAVFTEQYRDQPTSLPVLVERMGWEGPTMARIYTRGVDVELARRIPLPLMSKKWRAGPKVPLLNRPLRPILLNGASPGGGRANGPAVPTVGTRDTNRTALANPRKGSRLSV